MPTFSADELREIARDIFKAAGATEEEAELVSTLLVEANLAGHDSHGVIRVLRYVGWMRGGQIRPGVEVRVVKETPCLAVLDGNWGFGQMVAHKAMSLAMEKARHAGLSAVSVIHCNHVGRLADYTVMAAEQGMIGMMTVNSYHAQRVAPWGGIEPRLSTNPLSFAVPTGDAPLILDMSTSVVADGKVKVKLNREEEVPLGWLLDAMGQPTTDPGKLYGTPPGTILPLGGIVGYKGYGLSLVVDILSGGLGPVGCSGSDSAGQAQGNGVFIEVINVAHFTPLEDFVTGVESLIRNVKRSATLPGGALILIPGDPERMEREKRLKNGIFIEDKTWEGIKELAEEMGVTVPARAGGLGGVIHQKLR